VSKQKLRIDLVSDVSCPWCFLTYKRLELAIEAVAESAEVEVHWHPFELNLDLHQDGVLLQEFLQKRNGLSPEQSLAQQQSLVQLGQEVGIEFNFEPEMRIYNTRQAHKLIQWAQGEKQTELQLALFNAYFCAAKAIDQQEVLLGCVESIGLDSEQAQAVLSSDEWDQTVQDSEVYWLSLGVHAVPAIVVNQLHLISGAQPVDILVDALRDIAAEMDGV